MKDEEEKCYTKSEVEEIKKDVVDGVIQKIKEKEVEEEAISVFWVLLVFQIIFLIGTILSIANDSNSIVPMLYLLVDISLNIVWIITRYKVYIIISIVLFNLLIIFALFIV